MSILSNHALACITAFLDRRGFAEHQFGLSRSVSENAHNSLFGSHFAYLSFLTLKAPITTAADDKFCDIFPDLRYIYGMILHENRLPADDSHEISCLICDF